MAVSIAPFEYKSSDFLQQLAATTARKVDNGVVGRARFLRSGILVALALVALQPVESQYKPRPVAGMVTDKKGNTLPGAVVQLENTRSLVVQSYITQKDGRYHFEGLSEDVDYTLRARYRTYWSANGFEDPEQVQRLGQP